MCTLGCLSQRKYELTCMNGFLSCWREKEREKEGIVTIIWYLLEASRALIPISNFGTTSAIKRITC